MSGLPDPQMDEAFILVDYLLRPIDEVFILENDFFGADGWGLLPDGLPFYPGASVTGADA